MSNAVFPDEAIAAKYLIKTNYIFKVLEFHPETQTVDVVQDVFEFTNYSDGDVVLTNEFGISVNAGLVPPDYLIGVPVLQLRWGQFEIQCCPKPGDTGMLAVFTNDIREWIENGGPSIPNSDGHFMKESCIFIPFVPNNTSCATDYPTDNNSLVIKSANAKIVLTDDGTTSSITAEAKTMEVKAEDGVSITGGVSIDGGLSVTGKIESDEDVVADGISLKDHTHTIPSGTALVDPQTGMTTAPVQIPKPDEPTGV